MSRLLIPTPIKLDRAGQQNLLVDHLADQSKTLLLQTCLVLILVFLCARILNSTVLLVWLGLEQCAKLPGRDTMLESMKKEKMFWQPLRYLAQINYCKLCTSPTPFLNQVSIWILLHKIITGINSAISILGCSS